MDEKKTVREGYDDLAETYARQRSPPEREVATVDRFFESLSTPARLLDAGCGQGGPVLSRRPDEIDAVGVDLSRGQLDYATQSVPEVALAQGDISRLPLKPDSVDAVTACHSLIHLPGEQHQRVIDEFARVLRPGGRVLLSEGTGRWEGSNPDWLGSGTEMAWTIVGAETTREQLRSAGFTIVEESTAGDELADEEAEWLFFTGELLP